MVNEAPIKTGYWRINPETGEREWIEGSYAPKKPKLEEEEEEEEVEVEEPVSPLISSRELYELDVQWEDWWKEYQRTGAYPLAPAEERLKPYYDQWLQKVKEWEITQPPVEAVEPVRPEVPAVDVTDIASLYGLSKTSFVTPEQLADLALPPEERRVQWRIPYEQYLTWEQARYLGLDVPEGSVVLMTPMREDEPSFFLMTEPEAEVAKVQPAEDLSGELQTTAQITLVKHLRSAFPDMFDPSFSYGYSIEEIPEMVIEQLRSSMATNYRAFVDDLYSRVDQEEGETILRLLGVTEENILLTLDAREQELRVVTLVNDVLPDFNNLEDFGRLLETDFDLFLETMQTGPSSTEKRILLALMGYKPEEINQILSRQRVTVDVDGITQLLTVDIVTQAAFDDVGNYVGKYNPATREFTRAPKENILKDFWDWTMFQSRTMWEQGENFFLSVMPNIIYPEMDKGYMGGLGEFMNETNKQMRERFRFVYNANKQEYETWVRKHPELVAPVAYQEGAFQHPELLKDPKYYVYELANIMPFIIAATTMAVATGGVGLPAILGTAALMAPIEGQAVYEDLINAGAPEGKAAPMAAIAGAIIGLLESAGRIPLLKAVSPLLFGQFKRKAWSELAKQGLAETIKKFGRNFTLIHASEVFTEVAQEVVSNVAVGFYDEHRSTFENLPDIAVKTAVATLLPAGFGAGVSVRMIRPSQMQGLSNAAKKAKGWVQDQSGNWYEGFKQAVKVEEGLVTLPYKYEAEEFRPGITTEQLWNSMEVSDRALLAKQANLEGKLGSKAWNELTREEQDAVLLAREKLTPAVEAVKAEPGMPEAGMQPSMLPEEIAAKEVRPKAKAEIVQISMEDQLKLDQARKEAKEAPPEEKEAYEAQAEFEGLRVSLELDPVAQHRVLIGKRKVGKGRKARMVDDYRGLDFFISIREQTFPEYFTLKQAQALKPGVSFSFYAQEGTPQYNRVPRADALDELADKWNMTPDEIADRVEAIRRERRQIKALQDEVRTHFTEKRLAVVPETTTEEATTNLDTAGQPVLTTKQIKRTLQLFGKYVESESTISAWELTRDLRRETRGARAEILKARAQELMVSEGLNAEDAMTQAINETMAGELPAVRTTYLSDLTDNMRNVLFSKVYHVLKDEPFEMMSTVTALTNALLGKAIPRQPGVAGRSAWTRLQRVFGDQPIVFKAIEKMAAQKKPLKAVVEGMFGEIGRDPIPIDQEMADYLRSLRDIPQGFKTLLEPEFGYPVVSDLRSPADLLFAKSELELGRQFAEGKIDFDEFQYGRMEARDKSYPLPPVTKYEAPIEGAIKEIPLWPVPMRENVIKVLKEIGWGPVDIGNFLRANKASVDFSFWRQQAPLIVNHPVAFVQANVEAWKAIFSQKSAEASWQRITRAPLFQIYEVAAEEGGDFLRPLIMPKGTSQWRGTEEFGYLTGERLIPRLTGKIPWVKISARCFETGTNEHNWLIFKNYYNAMLKLSEQYATGQKTLKPGQVFNIQKEMVDFARSLTNFTARGSLGPAARLAPALSALFFAPRMSLGRLLSVKDLINANPRVRAEAWKNAATFVGTLGGIILLGAAAGWWEVEKDPKNAEYMSIRVGTTRLDPWGGYRQFLVFFTRVFTGIGLSSVTGAEYKVNPLTAATHFIRGKAAPLAAIISDFWVGRNFVGEEVEVANKKQWIERISPFAVWDIYEACMEDPWLATKIAIPAIVGAGVQTYTGDWVENWPKLGLPKYSENLVYGITEPKYDAADFWSDTSAQFKGVDPATLTKEKGFPEYIRAIAEARIIKEHLDTLPNEKLVNLNIDPAKGLTFAQYRQMWLQREKLVAAGDDAEWTLRELQPDGKYKKVTYKGEEAVSAFDKDERTRNAHLGNFSQRQFALLNEYWAITDPKEQAEFLEKHDAEIGINPRQDWLRSHSKENAQLAIWGQAKILTKEAYDEFLRLQKVLDIPDNAIPEMTLPPEGSAENYFERELAVQEYGAMSAEAMVVLARDPDLLKWFQDEAAKKGVSALEKPEFPERYYELKVKNRSEREYMETLTDKDSPTYIEDPDERRDAFLAEFPETGLEYFDDDRRCEAIANGFTDTQAEAWAERGRLVDQYSGGSPKVKEWAFDNPEAYAKALEEGILEDKGGLATDEERGHYAEWVEPAIRLQSKNMKEDAYWKELGDKSSPETYIEDDAARRKAFFERFPKSEYFDDLERIEAYKAGFTETESDLWAARGRVIGKFEPQSAEAKIWLVDHQDVFDKALEAELLTDDGSDWNVPALRITARWRAEDKEYDAIPEDDIEARKAYLAGEGLEGDALARRIEYRKDRRKKEAYLMSNKVTGATFPETEIENFVTYWELEVKGKRQERFLVDNPGFAEAMHNVAGIDIPKPEDVPAVQYDDIYDEWRGDFTRLEGLADNESEHYIEDVKDREVARDAMRFTPAGKYTDFGLAELRRNAYGKFVPEQYVDNYVGYYKIIGEGKPENWKLNTGTDLWYSDDWFLMEHIEFYREVYVGLFENERKDFTKVPSREVFNQYLEYLALPHLKAKDDFRWANRELDAWLVLKFDYTSIAEKRRRAELTPYERFIEKWAERGEAIEERLKALRE